MSKKIVFKIDKEGNVRVNDVEGYASGCLDATKAIEKALGLVDEASRRMTDEYDDVIQQDTDNHIQH